MNPVFLNCRIRIQFFFLVVWIRINSIRIRNPDVSAQPTTEMINHFSKNRKATMWIRMQYKPPDPNLVYMNDRILIQKNLSNLKLWIFFLFFVEYGYDELRCSTSKFFYFNSRHLTLREKTIRAITLSDRIRNRTISALLRNPAEKQENTK